MCSASSTAAPSPVAGLPTGDAADEHLPAQPARLRAVVTEAVCQGAATALAATQLQIGTAVNLGVVEQGFLPSSMDDDIADLMVSFEVAANAVLPKVDVDEILHANL